MRVNETKCSERNDKAQKAKIYDFRQEEIFALAMRVNETKCSERNGKAQKAKIYDFK